MIEEPGIWKETSCAIEIVPSNLTAGFVGGDFTTVKFNANVTFDAASESYDPDLTNTSDKVSFCCVLVLY